MNRHTNSRIMRGCKAAALGLTLTAFSPMTDSCMAERTAYAEPLRPQENAGAENAQSTRSPSANPFQLNQALRDILTEINPDASNRDNVQKLFDMLHSGGSRAVAINDGEGRPPRTATETLESGGDCTELATLTVALLKELNVPGGVLVVHFNSAPANVYHMIPYVRIGTGNERTIVDLQAGTLGSTGSGTYTQYLDLTYDQSAVMYYEEWGKYFTLHNQRSEAISAYERALECYEPYADVHHNLGVLYADAGDMTHAGTHNRRAAELAPDRYSQDQARTDYNDEMERANQAITERRWEEGIRHLQNILDSGAELSAENRAAITENLAICRASMEIDLANQAIQEERWADCVRHFQNAIDSGGLSTRDRTQATDLMGQCRERQ